MTLKELREKYKEVFGKNPAPMWKEDTLQEKLDEVNLGAVTPPDVKVEKANKSNVFMGIEIDPAKTYHFKLKHRSNPRSIMPREAKVWDETTNSVRDIRLCSSEASPYLDEQNPKTPIDSSTPIFTDGHLYISGVETSKVKYMLAFDGYDKKKQILPMNSFSKDMYELVDEGKITEDKLTKEDAIIDAKLVVRKASEKDLANFMSSVYLEPVATLTANEVKEKAYASADVDPFIILNEFTNPKHEIKSNIQKLFTKGELTDDNGVIKWKDTGAVITAYDEKERADEVLTKYVLLGEKPAKDFKERMEAKLK